MQRIIVLQPTRATAATLAYPDGSSKNETAPGAFDGTPWELARSNDIFGLQQAMLHQLGLVPSGLAETALLSQFLEGVVRLGSLGSLYTESGAANAYVVTQFGNIQPRLAYFDRMEIEFPAGNVNTGASTVDVDGIGPAAITTAAGAPLVGGEILASGYTKARYNLASTRFELALPDVALRQKYKSPGQTITSAGLLTLPHGLGVEPEAVNYVLQCTTAEYGYSIGDRIAAGFINSGVTTQRANNPVLDAVNISIRFASAAECFSVPNKTTGVFVNLTNASWQLYVKAFA